MNVLPCPGCGRPRKPRPYGRRLYATCGDAECVRRARVQSGRIHFATYRPSFGGGGRVHHEKGATYVQPPIDDEGGP